MSKSLPPFILVMAVCPSGTFRRCGIQFDRTWRPLAIGDQADLNAAIPVITDEMYALIKQVSEPQRLKTRLKTGNEKEGEAPAGTVVDNVREQIGPPMLALRPASEGEMEQFLELAKASPADKEGHILELRAHAANLEGRLMQLEMAGKQGVAAALAGRDSELAELRKAIADRDTANAALQKQLAELGARFDQFSATTKVDEKPAGKDAPKK